MPMTAAARSPNAERQRRYRDRARRGLKPVLIDVGPGLIERLIDAGRLAEAEALNHKSISAAIERFLDDITKKK